MNLQNIEISWRDYEVTGDYWAVWKGCVAKCVPRTRGKPKVSYDHAITVLCRLLMVRLRSLFLVLLNNC